MSKQLKISVIIPVYKNEASLKTLHTRLRALYPASVMELVFVNDASPDKSIDILQTLSIHDQTIRLIDLKENIGQQAAIRQGLAEASGDIVVVMDADLQDPPHIIPDLVTHLKMGMFDAVFAARNNSYQSGFRMMCSWGFRALIRLLTGLPKGAGGYVALSRKMVDRLLERSRPRFYLAGLIGCSGLEVSTIPVNRNKRLEGQSAFSQIDRIHTALSNIVCVLEGQLLSWR